MDKQKKLLELFVGDVVRVTLGLPGEDGRVYTLNVTGNLCEDGGHFTVETRKFHRLTLDPFTVSEVVECTVVGSTLHITLREQAAGKGILLT